MATGGTDGLGNAIDGYVWRVVVAASTLRNRDLRALEEVLAGRLRDVAGQLHDPGWNVTSGLEVRYRDLLRNMNGCLDALADAELLRRSGVYVRQATPWQTLRISVAPQDPWSTPIRTADLMLRERRNVIAEHRRPEEMALPRGEGVDLCAVSIRHFPMEGGRATEDVAIGQLAAALGVEAPSSAQMSREDSGYYERWLQRAEARAIAAPHQEYEKVRKALTRAYRDAPLAGPTVGHAAKMILQLVDMHVRALTQTSGHPASAHDR